MEQRPIVDNQYPYSNDTPLLFDSYDFSPDLQQQQQQQQQPAFALPQYEPAAVHLQHPTYSQHHASLDSAVESSRWEAYGGFDVANSQETAFGAASAGALENAMSQGGTIGDVLNHLPPASLQQSPPAGQYRPLSFDEEGIDGASHTVKPFITKLLELLDNPSEYRDCLIWTDDGRSVIICNTAPRLTQEILPRFFGHSNIHSFTRQLNVYGFRRMGQADLADTLATASTSEYSGWSNPFLLRDDRSMLTSLTPKPSRARMQKKMEKQERLQSEEHARRSANLNRRRASGSGSGSGSTSGASSGTSLGLSPTAAYGGNWSYPTSSVP